MCPAKTTLSLLHSLLLRTKEKRSSKGIQLGNCASRVLSAKNVSVPVCDCCPDLDLSFWLIVKNVCVCQSDCVNQLGIDFKLKEDEEAHSLFHMQM